jgi:hypothetical protein
VGHPKDLGKKGNSNPVALGPCVSY